MNIYKEKLIAVLEGLEIEDAEKVAEFSSPERLKAVTILLIARIKTKVIMEISGERQAAALEAIAESILSSNKEAIAIVENILSSNK